MTNPSRSPYERLTARLRSGEAVVAGLLSGTSADGVDVVLVRFPASGPGEPLPAPRALVFETRALPGELHDRLRAVLDGSAPSLGELAFLQRDLGRAHGRALREVARTAGLEPELVGSHGQTVWHHDGREGGAATLQIGDGDFVAEEACCAVASDFRQRDVAAGGQGAPLSALADDLLFSALPRPGAVLNLGGIANLTILGERGQPPLAAFDTGPANSLLDGLARRLLGRPFDAGGQAAVGGRVAEELLDELLGHEFLRAAPPKSTGRDTFGEAYVESVLQRARELRVLRGEHAPQDLLATAAELVAAAAMSALVEHSPGQPVALAVCGGGLKHGPLLDALARRAPCELASSADFGVDPDAREALVFAVLAARCVLGEPSTSPAATGAAAGRVLGKLSPAPWAEADE